MARAVRCPVCFGSGKVKDDTKTTSWIGEGFKVCHGCNGKGWVEVSER